MSKTVDIQIQHHTWIAGRSIYWGDALDAAAGIGDGADDTQEIAVLAWNVSGNEYHRTRTLMRWDVSQIPRNSKIVSAKVRLTLKEILDPGCPSPFLLSLYPLDGIPWSTNATFAKYDGTNNWSKYGLQDNVDYLASILATASIPDSATPDTVYELDVTDFIQGVIDRDDMAALLLFKAQDAYEKTNLVGAWGTIDPSYVKIFGLGEVTNQNRRPILRIVYTDPMAFFTSNQDGTINESREIFLGVGQYRIGSVVFSVTDTSYQETPCKVFLKNMLPSLTMKQVEIFSPPNWATYPEKDPANTGNGTVSDVSTSPTLTIDEQWKIQFTSASGFTVYRDSGTGDDPAQEQTWTSDGTGTVGTQYSSATRGISFTITAGGVAFVSGDKFYFRSYKDFSIAGAPSDSDHLLELCKDSTGTPDGNWYFARTAMTTLTQQVINSQVLPVANAKYFNPGNKVRIFKKATGWTTYYDIQSVNKTTNQITLVQSISAESGDWVHAQRVNLGDLLANQATPIWLRGVAFTDTAKEEKYQYLRAQEAI